MRKALFLFLGALSVAFLVACSSSGSSEPTVDIVAPLDAAAETSAEPDLVEDVAGVPDLAEGVDILPDVCVPACGDRNCGDDGCGGTCGTCIDNMLCFGGHCCQPQCDLKECGDDGCGGTCGACEDDATCVLGTCCSPNCDGRDCGSDGCGNWCGFCGEFEMCLDGVCKPDEDEDGIPDDDDRWPEDRDMPGVVDSQAVYAHSATTLYRMDVKSYELTELGDFSFEDRDQHLVTDMAIDQYGVLYTVSYEDLYVCHPESADCVHIGELPDAFLGMTMVPRGYLDPFRDTLVGIAEDGGWYRLDVDEWDVEATRLGAHGGPYTASGDAYSILDVGTFASVHKEDSDHDFIVALNPSNGEALYEVGPTEGYSAIFGLAGWTGHAFAFDKNGDILVVDTATGEATVIERTDVGWWGAGVRTIISQ